MNENHPTGIDTTGIDTVVSIIGVPVLETTTKAIRTQFYVKLHTLCSIYLDNGSDLEVDTRLSMLRGQPLMSNYLSFCLG